MRWLVFVLLFVITSCSVQKQLAKSANENVLSNKALATAHIGISIYEPATGKYWYEHQGDKYFVPASNTKIPTCYAAMKYLGDSLVGLRYGIPQLKTGLSNIVVIRPTGDPTFLHEDFKRQPVQQFLQQKFTIEKKRAGFLFDKSEVRRWGSGWSWNDYDEAYMAERSVFPVFGNVLNIKLEDDDKRFAIDSFTRKKYNKKLFTTGSDFFDSMVNKHPMLKRMTEKEPAFRLDRPMDENIFIPESSNTKFTGTTLPFVTARGFTAFRFIEKTFGQPMTVVLPIPKSDTTFEWFSEHGDYYEVKIREWNPIYSQPTDSMLKPMMHRSDNFFAEQSLLMVSNQLLGEMNDSKIIDSILKTDFKDLPQKPRWADGSGLSRYNLFTPEDMVAILNKMKTEFGMDRIKVIFPTGGEGTISSYYKSESGYLYAKTGTLSGVVALSGFLTTKKKKELIFSVLVNNHQASATEVRRAVEKFLQGVRNKY